MRASEQWGKIVTLVIFVDTVIKQTHRCPKASFTGCGITEITKPLIKIDNSCES